VVVFGVQVLYVGAAAKLSCYATLRMTVLDGTAVSTIFTPTSVCKTVFFNKPQEATC